MNTNLNQTATLSRRSLTTRRITFDALFAALYVVFACLISIKASIVEISFASFPVIFSAFLLGPVDAVLVALVGSFIEQCMTFGLTATTPLWMLGPVLQGLAVGLLVRLLPVFRNGVSGRARLVAAIGVVCVGELILSVFNTAALYLDGWIVGYPVKALHLIVIPRLVNCAFRTAICCVLTRFLLPPAQKLFTMRKN